MNKALTSTATDSRTQEEASKDLKDSSELEEHLIQAFISRVMPEGFEARHLGGSKSNPVGNVDVRPDFKVVGCIEVKHSKPHYTGEIHVKTENLKATKYHQGLILFVNGVESDKTEYALMNPERFLDDGQKGGYHGSPSRKLPYDSFEWREF